jgi:sodium-dependent phosphate cotransporter
MGANVGTTVTSTIVSLAQMGKSAELDRSFAAATLHDVFNIFTVAILFPVECATGYLQHLTGALAEGAETGRRDHFEGPIKKFVSPLSARLLTSNKKLIVGVANGKTCDDYYPIHCDEGAEPSFATCKVGLIGCYESTGRCPVLFRESASRTQDQVAGAVSFVIALIILFVSMLSMVFAVQKLLFGLSTKVVHTVTTCNGYRIPCRYRNYDDHTELKHYDFGSCSVRWCRGSSIRAGLSSRLGGEYGNCRSGSCQ